MPVTHATLVCAHAGCEGTPPDSLDSIRAGIDAGADVVELDLRFAPGGEPVLSHNRFRDGTRLVLLRSALEVLAAHPRVGINLDVKEPDGLGRLRDLLDALRPPNPLYCTGLRPRQTETLRRECPRVAYTVDALPWSFLLPGARVSALARLQSRGAMALNLDYRRINAHVVSAASAIGLPVHAWTVDAPHAMRRMVAIGVSSITTNRVALLRAILG